ncbi:S-adenosyl-L-methionine-dependent methyltransferase [Lophium mytilinum]|uniref:S-adenosyl-L-methionine-dependent methyltransferase n=1 Tax=Lophium mytilinum TaxID=390894 RepID=A0A6A6QH50_9PEZI|nr:S-adenosyl-L-methionine-dependent methyltransferase [Lophium mytilinum]
MRWPFRLLPLSLPSKVEATRLRPSSFLPRILSRNLQSNASNTESEARLLERLIEPCEDRAAAKNELRWLKEHVQKTAPGDLEAQHAMLNSLVDERSTGKPLQYILGTEYFGDLELECRPGVLIPRQETAASVSHLVHLLSLAPKLRRHLRVLDLCTGSGCIPLLFQHEFTKARPEIQLRLLGVDISPEAVQLARDNRSRLLEAAHLQLPNCDEDQENSDPSDIEYNTPRRSLEVLKTTEFIQADVLAEDPLLQDPAGPKSDIPSLEAALRLQSTVRLGKGRHRTSTFHKDRPKCWPVLICNPPYISPDEFVRTTSRSVREFEPKTALIPPVNSQGQHIDQADTFYPRLLELANTHRTMVVLFEVADMAQALRVAQMAKSYRKPWDETHATNKTLRDSIRSGDLWDSIEIWRDQPGQARENGVPEVIDGFQVAGRGNGRSVVCWKYAARRWFGDEHPISAQIAKIKSQVT